MICDFDLNQKLNDHPNPGYHGTFGLPASNTTNVYKGHKIIPTLPGPLFLVGSCSKSNRFVLGLVMA